MKPDSKLVFLGMILSCGLVLAQSDERDPWALDEAEDPAIQSLLKQSEEIQNKINGVFFRAHRRLEIAGLISATTDLRWDRKKNRWVVPAAVAPVGS